MLAVMARRISDTLQTEDCYFPKSLANLSPGWQFPRIQELVRKITTDLLFFIYNKLLALNY
jgi:hypothetical protein